MKLAIFLSVLVAAAHAQATVDTSQDQCLFNSTHCACTMSTDIGLCLRHISGAFDDGVCAADTCQSGGYKCDCLGASLCEIGSCSAWKQVNSSDPKPTVGDTNVQCKRVDNNPCLTKLESALPEPEPEAAPVSVPAPEPTPAPAPVIREYKMVQFGAVADAGYMWNMTYQQDTDDAMIERFASGKGRSMHDRWPGRETLKMRQINMRLYKSADLASQFVCAIINTYGVGNDALGLYKVRSTISSTTGKALSFMQCDDWSGAKGRGECATPLTASVLSAYHRGVVTHSDGWCVGPLEMDGSGISIKFTDVENIEGINFLDADSLAEYSFLDGTADGMTGTVNEHGLVMNGEIPEIIVNPSGIVVPVSEL